MISYQNFKNTYNLEKGVEFKLDQISNPETLNIFTDSAQNRRGRAFGAILVNQNNIINKDIRKASDFTNNTLELFGIRLGLGYVPIYAPYYPFINIFSDSDYAVNMIKTGVYNWRFNGKIYIDKTGGRAKNQEVLLEITNTLLTYCLLYGYHINIFYCPAHAVFSNEGMMNAKSSFSRVNNITRNVDINLIRYICTFNHNIDRAVYKLSQKVDGEYYEEAIEYIPSLAQIKF